MAKDKAKDTTPPVKENAKGATLNVDGKEYPIADLSNEAKASLQGLRFTDEEVRRLTMQLSVAKTARNAYRQALIAALPKD